MLHARKVFMVVELASSAPQNYMVMFSYYEGDMGRWYDPHSATEPLEWPELEIVDVFLDGVSYYSWMTNDEEEWLKDYLWELKENPDV